MTNKEIAQQIANLMNSFSVKPDEIAAELRKEHRTLQQTFTRVAVAYLKRCAEDDANMFDDRNIATHEFAVKIKPVLDEAVLPFI